MLRMRLRRTGAKKQPRYRIVIMESQSKRDGAFVDWLGFYDPLTNPPTVRVNEERTRHWLSKGVSMSDTVRGLLRRTGVEEGAAVAAAELVATSEPVAAAEPVVAEPVAAVEPVVAEAVAAAEPVVAPGTETGASAGEDKSDEAAAEEAEAPSSRRSRSRKQE